MSLALSSPAILSWAVSAGDEPARPRARMTPSGEPVPPDERNLADARLLQRMAAGDQRALGELYDRFSRPLYATALRIVNDTGDSQDIVHDVFVTLWEKASVFATERGTAFSWAVTLTRNRAIDRLRLRRRRAALLEQSAASDLGYDENPAGADAQAQSSDQALAVRSAVAALPPDQKSALELAFFSGLTQQEIAERLQEPLGTVKARIRRGLLKLRDGLAHRL